MKHAGIECKRVNVVDTFGQPRTQLYSDIPLKSLHDLPPRSDIAKVMAILWCYGAMAKKQWFSVSNAIYKKYGVSPRQKLKILRSLEVSGYLELKEVGPGKSLLVCLNRPKGWK